MWRLVLLKFLFFMGCGVTSRQVVIHETVRPKLPTLRIPTDCMISDSKDSECRGESFFVSGESASSEVISAVGLAIADKEWHRAVFDPNAAFSVRVKVTEETPQYDLRETMRQVPQQCLERKESCTPVSGYQRCLKRAQTQLGDKQRQALADCHRHFQRCHFVCTRLREAYTEFSVAETCSVRIMLQIVRLMEHDGSATASADGQLIGAPVFDGGSNFTQVVKNRRPLGRGESETCRQATRQAVAKMKPWFNVSQRQRSYLVADFDIPTYNTALIDLRFGRYRQALESMEQSFALADQYGLKSQDMAWLHHAKALAHFFLGQREPCLNQLRLAAQFEPELARGARLSSGNGGLYGAYEKLLGQCSSIQEL